MLVAMPLWEVAEPGRLLISSGLATMGYALPAAIAAALCAPAVPVVAFTGDGGLGMTLAELETAVRLSLPVIVVVFNDAALSLIEIKQQPAGQGGAEAVRYRPVSFAAAATALGAAGAAVSTEPGPGRRAGRRAAPARPHRHRRSRRPGLLSRGHGPDPGAGRTQIRARHRPGSSTAKEHAQ